MVYKASFSLTNSTCLFPKNEVPFGKLVLFVVVEYELSHNGTIPLSIFVDEVHSISIN
jgi:hypothetical protein